MFFDRSLEHLYGLRIRHAIFKDAIPFKIDFKLLSRKKAESISSHICDYYKKTTEKASEITDTNKSKEETAIELDKFGNWKFPFAKPPYPNTAIVYEIGEEIIYWVTSQKHPDKKETQMYNIILIGRVGNRIINTNYIIYAEIVKGMFNFSSMNFLDLHNGKVLKIPEHQIWEMHPNGLTAVYRVFNFFSFLNCKNIEQVKVDPPEKLQKKRKKRNKKPLVSYYTLRVIPNKMKQNTISSPGKGNNPYRIHTCRGHFKEFTKEKPLLGKYAGLYWWDPYVRGNKKKGKIIKDYEVGEDEE